MHDLSMSETNPLRLGFLCRSGGGLIDAMACVQRAEDWPYSIEGIITDRPCGAEEVARTHNVAHQRIVEADENLWSEQVADVFRRWKVDLVVLLILRRVGPALWQNPDFPAWNLHPTLLPAYPGLDAIKRNYEEAERDPSIPLGVTLHVANGKIDTGPIIAQARIEKKQASTFEDASHLSFLLMVIIMLEGMQRFSRGDLMTTEQKDVHSLPWDGSFRGMVPQDRFISAAKTLAHPWAKTVLEDLAGVRF